MAAGTIERRRIALYGAVQGVGFRPFVYRLATELGLAGWVLNSSAGLVIEVEGDPRGTGPLPRAPAPGEARGGRGACAGDQPLVPAGLHPVRNSVERRGGRTRASLLPDLATCPECLAELLDPANRRFGYPFTNCTNCGPRYSIILDIPYDRPRTTMRGFTLCPECAREYTDPADRRFHAQPNACPRCGPRLGPNATLASAIRAHAADLRTAGSSR